MSHDWTPPPPPPPEMRIECSSCGFIAPQSEFNSIHGKTCRKGALFIMSICLAVASGAIVLLLSILQKL